MTQKCCLNCQSTFSPKHANQKHCGPSCRKQYQASRKRMRQLTNSIERFGKMNIRICRNCENEYRPKDMKNVYCSKRCHRQWSYYDLRQKGYFKRPEVQDRQRASSQRYAHSKKGIAAQRVRDNTPEAVARRQAYKASPQGKATARRYQRERNAIKQLGKLIYKLEIENGLERRAHRND